MRQELSEDDDIIENDIVKYIKDTDTIVDKRIQKTIKVLENGRKFFSDKQMKNAIELLNEQIIKRNMSIDNPTQGIIIQLEEPKKFIHQVARLYTIECQVCNFKLRGSGNSNCSIFAHPCCTQCGNANLKEIPYTWRSLKNLICGNA